MLTGHDDIDRAELERAAAQPAAVAVEEAIITAGGCAAAMRERAVWAAHPAGTAAAAASLITWGEPHHPGTGLPDGGSPARPAAGLRVLDLTRVIAGPIAGRTLAALGADVLRLDPPTIAELPGQHLDTDPGKRTALLDLADRERREALLAGADVLLCGYRPGALARFGLDGPALAERHPHIVQVSHSAWAGPWEGRRGFDSLVQTACGIARRYADGAGNPGALPAQALDHGTGHLIAAAALTALARRARGEMIAPGAALALHDRGRAARDAGSQASPAIG